MNSNGPYSSNVLLEFLLEKPATAYFRLICPIFLFSCISQKMSFLAMDIRKWLNKGPKGLTKEPKSPKLKQKVKKKHQLDSSSDEEEEVVTVRGLNFS